MSETTAIFKEVLENIKKHFKFLFDRGYVIDSAKNIDPSWDVWEVVLKNQDFFLKFEEEKGGLDLSFGSPSKGFMRIRALIYFLSKEKNFIKLGGGFFDLSDFFRSNLEREAKLLQQHIDEFESSFESRFPITEEELKLAENRYYKKLTGQ